MNPVQGHPHARDAQARRYVAAAIAAAAAIVAVEALLVMQGHLLAAQIADAVLVLVLVNSGPAREPQPLSDRAAAALGALRALALVPLIRVVALGLPMRNWSEPLAVLAIALPIGAIALRLAPVVGLGLKPLLSVRAAAIDVAAVAAGAALGLVAYLAGAEALWPKDAPADRIAFGVAAAIVAAIVEELVFRGLVQGTLQRAAGRLGLLMASATFAATYLDAGSATLVLTFVLAGAVFAYVVARTGALPGVILGHVLLVAGAGAIWPTLLEESVPTLHGPVTTIALSVAIAAVTLMTVRRPPAGVTGAAP
jgi:membrane protease YdiL (CAAX protease family)